MINQSICQSSSSSTTQTFNHLCIFPVKPHFVKVDDQPHNINMTEGEDATFRCAAVAEPEAETQWYKNGKPIDCKYGKLIGFSV